MATVFALPGLGSHHYQMGKTLAASDAYFKYQIEKYDDLIKSQLGWSIVEFLFDPKKKQYQSFDNLIKASLSTFIFEIAAVNWLENKGVFPDYYLASSFGTLVAGVVSGCLSEEDGVHYIEVFAKAFENNSGAGGMLAVMKDTGLYYQDPDLMELSELSAFNFDAHFVLSFPEQNRSDIERILKKKGVAQQNIPISRAFHSRWVESAKFEFLNYFDDIGGSLYSPPIVSVAHKELLPSFDAKTFWEVFRLPMYFRDTLLWLESQGTHKYIDVGPSGTLATFMKYALPAESRSSVTALFSPYSGHTT